MSNPWDDPRIQRGMKEQLAKRRACIAAGEAPLGWKVGFGAPAMMEKLKITAPLVGFLMQRALIPSGGSASLRGWAKPVAEPEIAAHIGRDVPGGGDRDAAAAAIMRVAALKQDFQQRITAAPAGDKERLASEAMTALTKAVTDQGLSVQEYTSILEVAQSNPEVREKIRQRLRPSAK